MKNEKKKTFMQFLRKRREIEKKKKIRSIIFDNPKTSIWNFSFSLFFHFFFFFIEKLIRMKSPHPYYDEKSSEREARIKSLFETLDYRKRGYLSSDDVLHSISAHARYDLLKKCDREGTIDFEAFKSYIVEKEKNLWRLYSEVNRSSDFKLGPKDLSSALEAAGIHVTSDDIIDFIQCIDTGNKMPSGNYLTVLLEGNGYIDFEDWRNFLLVKCELTTP